MVQRISRADVRAAGVVKETTERPVVSGLVDKVCRAKTLALAWEKVKANRGGAGVDGQTIEKFERDADRQLARLGQELQDATYHPQPVKRTWIEKPGGREKRPLGVPAVRDRVVQSALRLVIEPIFEKEFRDHSYGFRPGRGCKDALRDVQRGLDEGRVWVVDADIRSYFDSIPHAPLMAEVRRRIADGRVLTLIEAYLKAGVMEGMKEWTPESGTPQGAVISPLLANVYLHPVDEVMEQKGRIMVRYADDFVILCRSREEAGQALAEAREQIEARGLSLHPDKTRIVNAAERGGFDFLGYHFERGYRWPRKKSEAKLREAIRPLTRRTTGESLACIIAKLNRKLRGWFEYFKHSHENTFRDMDGWVRRRLRSILRRRSKRKGISHGADHQRWPNAYFHKQGLLSLEQARAAILQSRTG